MYPLPGASPLHTGRGFAVVTAGQGSLQISTQVEQTADYELVIRYNVSFV